MNSWSVFAKVFAGTLATSVVLNFSHFLYEWNSVSDNDYWWGPLSWLMVPYVLSFVASLILLPLGVLLLFSPSTRRHASDLLVLVCAHVLISYTVIDVARGIRRGAFADLATRSESLVVAVRSYESDKGEAPTTLELLVPDYLPEVPSTGMNSYPEYRIRIPEKPDELNGNPWAISVYASDWGHSFDQFIYLPNQVYPERGYGGFLEPIEGWAYVHE